MSAVHTHRLIAEILARYGTLDAFIAALHVAVPGTPHPPQPATTDPVVSFPLRAPGRHRLRETA